MVQTLEPFKSGGDSIKVGATGTISSLMTRELESIKSAPQVPVSSRNKPRTVPISVTCGAATPKRLQPRRSVDEASSSGSGSGNNSNCKSPRKVKGYTANSHRIPILKSDNIDLDRTPTREKSDKTTHSIVEIVDIKCGGSGRVWTSPITNRLRKLGFSKLSESII